eukprot:759283-Hanusia_phi.AAC.2
MSWTGSSQRRRSLGVGLRGRTAPPAAASNSPAVLQELHRLHSPVGLTDLRRNVVGTEMQRDCRDPEDGGGRRGRGWRVPGGGRTWAMRETKASSDGARTSTHGGCLRS